MQYPPIRYFKLFLLFVPLTIPAKKPGPQSKFANFTDTSDDACLEKKIQLSEAQSQGLENVQALKYNIIVSMSTFQELVALLQCGTLASS